MPFMGGSCPPGHFAGAIYGYPQPGAVSPGGIAPFMGGRYCPSWVQCVLHGWFNPRTIGPSILLLL